MTAKPTDLSASLRLVDDRSLLRRFLQDDDSRAFAEIVQRHSKLVMSVCRRVVGQAADVDDAFQATFLALAQRPRNLRRCRSLAGWLYCVAFRTSRRLVRQRNKKAMGELPETGASVELDPIDQIARASDMTAVDEELQALPLKYRDVLVMTYFSGQSSQQIADQLDVSKGAVDGRIRQARNALRVRLARRGVELGAIGFAAAMVSSVSAQASPALIQSTIALGQASLNSAAGVVSVPSHLDSLITQEITMLKMKALLTTGLAGVLVVAAIGLAQPFSAAGAGEAPPQLATDADGDVSAGPEQPVLLGSLQEAAGSAPASPGGFGGMEAPDGSGGMAFGIGPPVNSRPDQYSGYSSSAKRKAAARIREVLSGPSPALEFPGETPLTEVLQYLRDQILQETGIDLAMIPDRAELELEAISSLDDVTVTDLQFTPNVTLHSVFEHIFNQTADPNLDYVIKDEVMLITTRSAAEQDTNMETRLYDVTTILPMFKTRVAGQMAGAGEMGLAGTGMSSGGSGPGGMMGGMESGMGGMAGGMGGMEGGMMGGMAAGGAPATGPVNLYQQVTPVQQLLELIQDITSPTASWQEVDGEGGRIGATETHLIIRQSRRGHEAIVDVLEQLQQTAAGGGY